ncbi:MAG: hypothetical protein ACP5OU_02875, partial [Methanothrix sp.]
HRRSSMEDMTVFDRTLEAAAGAISTSSLQEAKRAVAASCQEYLRWAGLFSRRLESLPDGQLHKFARAFSLTLLGHLPARPETCPFCIQYGHDKSCTGCGYAATHGRCDEEDSAFSLFIEAFQELGRAVYQDTTEIGFAADEARQILYSAIAASSERALQMQKDLPSVGARGLMELKAAYLDAMICQIPVQLFGEEVRERSRLVREALLDYW